jgi:hypothetical protein
MVVNQPQVTQQQHTTLLIKPSLFTLLFNFFGLNNTDRQCSAQRSTGLLRLVALKGPTKVAQIPSHRQVGERLTGLRLPDLSMAATCL